MKKIKYIVFSIIALFTFSNKVLAGGSISVNKSQVAVGSSFTVTASISDAASWDVHVSASGPVSGCSIQQAGYTQDLSATSKSWSATCRTTGTGSVTVSLSGTTTNADGNTTGIVGTRTVSVVSGGSSGGGSGSGRTTNNNKKEDNKSSNNYLSRYEIEGYKISPEFKKDTTDYTLTVPNGTKEVRIIQEKEDKKATVSGDDGTVEVKEGENKFSTTVTAENGSKRTYNITITVDSKPIVVKLNGKEYTLVKNKDELPKLDIDHEDMTLEFEEQQIPAYRIDKIGYVLVGLKDSEGNIKLYRYISYKDNEKPEEYYLFNYLKIRDMYFIYLDFPKNKIPKNYKKYTEVINEENYIVYKINKNSKYSLLYLTSLDNGKTNVYRYESNEKTVQLYTNEETKLFNIKLSKYEKLILILGAVILLLLLLTTIGFTKKPKDNNKDELSKKDIKKIEKDTKKEEKKNKKKQKNVELDL